MASSLLEEIVAENAVFVRRLNVDQLHQMLAAGIIRDGEPVELIDGLLVNKDRRDGGGKPMSHGPRHAAIIRRLGRLEERVRTYGFHVLIQLPVTLSDVSEPEPDAAILRGDDELYAKRHPQPDDIAVVFEVADTSLRYDQTKKQRVYAAAGIPVYCIVNLCDGVIELYDAPATERGEYERRTILTGDDVLQLVLSEDAEIQVKVADLLP